MTVRASNDPPPGMSGHSEPWKGWGHVREHSRRYPPELKRAGSADGRGDPRRARVGVGGDEPGVAAARDRQRPDGAQVGAAGRDRGRCLAGHHQRGVDEGYTAAPENAELQRANALLKAAAAFFASMPSSGVPGRGSLVSLLPRVRLVACRPLCGSGQVSTGPPDWWLDRSLPQVVDALN